MADAIKALFATARLEQKEEDFCVRTRAPACALSGARVRRDEAIIGIVSDWPEFGGRICHLHA